MLYGMMNVLRVQNNTLVSGDNKGMAAYLYECELIPTSTPVVANSSYCNSDD